jgi:hypothetical protein
MSRKPSKMWILGLLGAGMVIAGCILPWLDTGGITVGEQSVVGDPVGLDLVYVPFAIGWIALGAGIAAAVFALLILVIPRWTRVWGAGLLLSGALAIALGVTVLLMPRDLYIQFAGFEIPGQTADELSGSLNALFDNGGIKEDPGVGVFVTLAGGGLVIIAGLIATLRRRKAPRSELPVQGSMGEPGRVPEPPAARDVDEPRSGPPETDPAVDTASAERDPAVEPPPPPPKPIPPDVAEWR